MPASASLAVTMRSPSSFLPPLDGSCSCRAKGHPGPRADRGAGCSPGRAAGGRTAVSTAASSPGPGAVRPRKRVFSLWESLHPKQKVTASCTRLDAFRSPSFWATAAPVHAATSPGEPASPPPAPSGRLPRTAELGTVPGGGRGVRVDAVDSLVFQVGAGWPGEQGGAQGHRLPLNRSSRLRGKRVRQWAPWATTPRYTASSLLSSPRIHVGQVRPCHPSAHRMTQLTHRGGLPSSRGTQEVRSETAVHGTADAAGGTRLHREKPGRLRDSKDVSGRSWLLCSPSDPWPAGLDARWPRSRTEGGLAGRLLRHLCRRPGCCQTLSQGPSCSESPCPCVLDLQPPSVSLLGSA